MSANTQPARRKRKVADQESAPPENVLITEPPKQLLVTVDEMARMLAIGKSLAWKIVLGGSIVSVHVGRYRRVPVKAIESYVESLMAPAS